MGVLKQTTPSKQPEAVHSRAVIELSVNAIQGIVYSFVGGVNIMTWVGVNRCID